MDVIGFTFVMGLLAVVILIAWRIQVATERSAAKPSPVTHLEYDLVKKAKGYMNLDYVYIDDYTTSICTLLRLARAAEYAATREVICGLADELKERRKAAEADGMPKNYDVSGGITK